jgi:flagellin FlaB
MNIIVNSEDAFTGLEAAIVLIAFVVVAMVFSFVVLGGGFFTTQKSQDVVYTGVSQASSSMAIMGDVIGLKSASTLLIDRVRCTVALTIGGSPVDFSDVTLTWSDASNVYIFEAEGALYHTDYPDPGKWRIIDIRNGATTDTLLEDGELFTVAVFLRNGTYVAPNGKFNLEIKPSVGAALGIRRTGPAKITDVNLLY